MDMDGVGAIVSAAVHRSGLTSCGRECGAVTVMREVGHGLGVEMSEGLGVSRRHSVTAMLAAALVAGACLTGCGDGDSDEPADSGLPSESESTTSTPTAPATETTPASATQPVMPDAATRPGRAGARAFVAYYIALENYASDTGDVGPLRDQSHPQCGGCGDLILFYRKWYDRGGWFKGAHREIVGFDRVVRASQPHDVYLRLHGRTASGTFREHRGAEVKRARGESFDLLVWLVREREGWRVSRLDTP
jgi:Family of unknown function (DUF6318)